MRWGGTLRPKGKKWSSQLNATLESCFANRWFATVTLNSAIVSVWIQWQGACWYHFVSLYTGLANFKNSRIKDGLLPDLLLLLLLHRSFSLMQLERHVYSLETSISLNVVAQSANELLISFAFDHFWTPMQPISTSNSVPFGVRLNSILFERAVTA